MKQKRILITVGVSLVLVAAFMALRWFRAMPDRLPTRGIHERGTRSMMAFVNTIVEQFTARHGRFPTEDEWRKAMADATYPTPRDSWGTPLRYTLADEQAVITSAGPDKTYGTRDDLTQSAEQPVGGDSEIRAADGADSGAPQP